MMDEEQEGSAAKWLRKLVDLRIDRPIGTAHPDWPDMIYQVNYGFLPDTAGGDGEAIDAYVIDSTEKLTELEAWVIGYIVRHDDEEFKLVCATSYVELAPDEIAQKVHFSEQYFTISIATPLGFKSYSNRSVAGGDTKWQV